MKFPYSESADKYNPLIVIPIKNTQAIREAYENAGIYPACINAGAKYNKNF